MTHCQTLKKDLIKSLYYTTNNYWEKAKKQVYRNQSSGLSYFLSLTRCLGKFDGVCELMLRYIMTEKLIREPTNKIERTMRKISSGSPPSSSKST